MQNVKRNDEEAEKGVNYTFVSPYGLFIHHTIQGEEGADMPIISIYLSIQNDHLLVCLYKKNMGDTFAWDIIGDKLLHQIYLDS